MLFRRLIFVLALLAGWLSAAGPASGAQGTLQVKEPATPSTDAYLEKMASSSRATYQARQLVVYLGPPQSAAIIETRVTPQARFVRAEAGGNVLRLWQNADHRVVSGPQMAMEEIGPYGHGLEMARVAAKYDVTAGDPSELLGIAVVPLDFTRRRDGRLVERLWVHTESGVVYRRELLGERGRVIGISTVLEMRWGHSDRPEPYGGAKPARIGRSSAANAPSELAYGYRLVGSYRLRAHGREATHLVYSDGMHSLSVFRMPGRLRKPHGYTDAGLKGVQAWTGPGPATWMWQGDRWIWTIVAEEAQLDPTDLMAPFPKRGPSVLAGMGAWWAEGLRRIRDLF